MITKELLNQLLRDLFADFLPKVKSAERKEFTAALIEELEAIGLEFEESYEETDLFDSLEDED